MLGSVVPISAADAFELDEAEVAATAVAPKRSLGLASSVGEGGGGLSGGRLLSGTSPVRERRPAKIGGRLSFKRGGRLTCALCKVCSSTRRWRTPPSGRIACKI